MSAALETLLAELRRRQATLTPVGQRLRVSAPEPLPPGLIEQLREHRDELKIHALLACACQGLPITPDGFRKHLAFEDLEDHADRRIGADTQRAYAESIANHRAGGLPPPSWCPACRHYDAGVTSKSQVAPRRGSHAGYGRSRD